MAITVDDLPYAPATANVSEHPGDLKFVSMPFRAISLSTTISGLGGWQPRQTYSRAEAVVVARLSVRDLELLVRHLECS